MKTTLERVLGDKGTRNKQGVKNQMMMSENYTPWDDL